MFFSGLKVFVIMHVFVGDDGNRPAHANGTIAIVPYEACSGSGLYHTCQPKI